jgi:hypothetical protein
MVGQSTDIAKEIGDLQGKTAFGAVRLHLEGQRPPVHGSTQALGACVRSAGVFASIPLRASRSDAKTAATSLLFGPNRRLVEA